jgi:hypothetical protein
MQKQSSETFRAIIFGLLVILGLLCWVVRAFLSPNEATWSALILGVFIWVGAAASARLCSRSSLGQAISG